MRASRYIKCIIVGDVAVGKTCLVQSQTTNTFREDNVPTILDSLIQNVVVDGATVNLGIWDTAGQEYYKRLRPLGYHDADVFILAFSLVSKTSYDNVFKKWYPELKLNAPRVPIVLVGTKLDLRDDKQYFIDNPGVVPISHAQGAKLKELIGAPAYIECSSKTQQNVKSVFDAAIREVLQPPKSSQKALITYGRRKSDKPYYPIETVEGILLNLDPVSLVRFRQVCQGWNGLISSERFIRAHLNKQFGCYRRQGLFLDSNRRIYSGDIDGLADGIHKIVETHLEPRIVGSATEGFVEFIGESNGLMCYTKTVRRMGNKDKLSFCIWNPSTNECMERLDSSAVSLVPNDQSIFGFGYDQSKDDYRIIHLYWHAELPDLLHLEIRFVSTWNLRVFLMEVDPDRLSHMTRSPVVFVNGGFHCLMRKSELPDAQYSILSYSVDRVLFEQNIPVPSLRATKDTKYELSVVDGQMFFLARDAAAGYYEVWILKNEGEEPVWSLKIAVTKGAEEYDTIRPLCFTRRGGVVVLEDWDLKIFYKENVGRLVADDGGVLGPERAMGYLESLVSPYRMPNAEIQRCIPYREIETKKYTFDDVLDEEAFEKETKMENLKELLTLELKEKCRTRNGIANELLRLELDSSLGLLPRARRVKSLLTVRFRPVFFILSSFDGLLNILKAWRIVIARRFAPTKLANLILVGIALVGAGWLLGGKQKRRT